MSPYITTALATTIIFSIIAIVLASKIVEGANVQRIAKGHATKSKDEIRQEIRVVRVIISTLILSCLAGLLVLSL